MEPHGQLSVSCKLNCHSATPVSDIPDHEGDCSVGQGEGKPTFLVSAHAG